MSPQHRLTLAHRPDSLGLTYRRVKLAAGDTAYIDEGNGPPILLLHGAPLSSLGFFHLVAALRSEYRLPATDFPGFGDSDAAPDFAGTLASYSDFVVDFWRALDLRGLTVFVNDSSGPIGIAAAAALADRVDVALQRLTPAERAALVVDYRFGAPPVAGGRASCRRRRSRS